MKMIRYIIGLITCTTLFFGAVWAAAPLTHKTLVSAPSAQSFIQPSQPSYFNINNNAPNTPPINNTVPAHQVTPLINAGPQFINGIVAIVNNQVITWNQLNQQVHVTKIQAQQNGMELPDQTSLERQVLNQMITQKIALQLAGLNDISVSNTELENTLKAIAANNRMSVTQLEHVAVSHGLTLSEYKQMIRDRLTLRKIEQQAVANTIMVSPQEVDNYLAEQAKFGTPNEQYDVQHILIGLPQNPTPQDITNAKQKALDVIKQIHDGLAFTQAAVKYSDAGDALSGGDLGWKTLGALPTIFVHPVATMKVGEIVGPIQTDDGFHIIKLVNKQTPPDQQHFTTEYHVWQILVEVSPVKSSTQAKVELQELRRDIQNGQSFADIAKANSQDENSRSEGGDLGWVRPSDLDTNIAQAVTTLPLNTLSQPIQASNGWYLVEVVGKKRVNDTEQYRRDQARQAIFEKKANQAVDTWESQIRGASYVKILVPQLSETP